MSDRVFRIHDLAKRLKISSQSIRNYEKRGIFPPPRTDEKGWRYYTEDDINKIVAYYFPPVRVEE